MLGARVRHWGEGEALAPEALLELGEVPLVPLLSAGHAGVLGPLDSTPWHARRHLVRVRVRV